MSVIFFGAGQLALSLAQRISTAYTISAVVISRPKPTGRGRKTQMPRIAQWAQQSNIHVFAPTDPNDESFIRDVAKCAPALFVLASYGHILGPALLAVPVHGGINVHPSLLPRYRGAAPIQRVLMSGEEKTGITVISMDEKIDHGGIIFRQEVNVDFDDTYGSLYEKLANLATNSIIEVIQNVLLDKCQPVPQDESKKSYAHKIRKEETFINWHETTLSLHNLIRALSPHPGAQTHFRGRGLKIMRVQPREDDVQPGHVQVNKNRVLVGTKDGALLLEEVQPENRKVISGSDFLNGFRLRSGEVME